MEEPGRSDRLTSSQASAIAIVLPVRGIDAGRRRHHLTVIYSACGHPGRSPATHGLTLQLFQHDPSFPTRPVFSDTVCPEACRPGAFRPVCRTIPVGRWTPAARTFKRRHYTAGLAFPAYLYARRATCGTMSKWVMGYHHAPLLRLLSLVVIGGVVWPAVVVLTASGVALARLPGDNAQHSSIGGPDIMTLPLVARGSFPRSPSAGNQLCDVTVIATSSLNLQLCLQRTVQRGYGNPR